MTLPQLHPFSWTADLAPRSCDAGRRILNFVIATLALVLALPLMTAIAVLIKLTSPGPVLFTQRRIGLDRRAIGNGGGNFRRHADSGGRTFTMYKFRTMHVNGGASHEVWARRDDPRVTAVGRVLRKLRLDELPQFWNVLVGDMNVVGPRPEQPAIFASLRDQIEEYQRRQRVLPGITGWAQVRHGYVDDIDGFDKKLALDLYYMRNWCLGLDLSIVWTTVRTMLAQRGV